ncbi:hypothetical protein DSUL_20213 [Desulfovibrionales bacterium]
MTIRRTNDVRTYELIDQTRDNSFFSGDAISTIDKNIDKKQR